MSRLLITGNSHVAALKAAWDAMTDRPQGLKVDFLATIARYYPQFIMASDGRFGLLDESRLIQDHVELARSFNDIVVRNMGDYSHVLIAGCYFGYASILEVLSEHRVDLIRETPEVFPRLSQAAFAAFAHAIALKKLPSERIKEFRPWCKVALAASPRLSETVFTSAKAYPYIQSLARDCSGVRAALALTDAALDQAITAQGVRFFRAPESSIAASGFTLERYSRDSARIKTGKASDNSHMNAEYGALCLAPILAWVAGA